MADVLGGFQPDTKSESARRADFDLRRRIAKGGGGGDSFPPDGDPGEVLTIDSGGTPVWAPGATGIVQTVVAGENIEVDSTDPANPIVSTTPLMTIDGILRNWNSAWGVVAFWRGSVTQVNIPPATQADLQGSLTFKPDPNRRYRLTYYMRAAGTGETNSALSADGVEFVGLFNPWFTHTGNWTNVTLMFSATGAELGANGNSRVYTVRLTNAGTTNTFSYWADVGTTFIAEDLGPVSPTLPAPPPAETTTWTNLPLGPNWVSQPSLTPQYRKVDDEVQMRGTIAWQSPFGGNPIGTLPVGFRPGRVEANSTAMFMDVSGNPISAWNGIYGPRLVARANGLLEVIGMNTSFPGYLSVDSVRFSTTP